MNKENLLKWLEAEKKIYENEVSYDPQDYIRYAAKADILDDLISMIKRGRFDG